MRNWVEVSESGLGQAAKVQEVISVVLMLNFCSHHLEDESFASGQLSQTEKIELWEHSGEMRLITAWHW